MNSGHSPSSRLTPLLLGVALMGVALAAAMAASAWHMWPVARAGAASMQALAQVRAWQAPRAKPPDLPAWLETRADLARALTMAPDSADLHEAMAFLYLQGAQRPDQSPLVKTSYLKQALVHLEQATAARPMVSSTWTNTALALHQLAAMEAAPERAAPWLAALWPAFDRAMVFGQRSSGAQQGVGAVAFSRWADLSPQRRQSVKAMVASAAPAQQRALLALASAHRVVLEP